MKPPKSEAREEKKSEAKKEDRHGILEGVLEALMKKTKNNKAGNRGRCRQHAQVGREPFGSTGADGAWPGDGFTAREADRERGGRSTPEPGDGLTRRGSAEAGRWRWAGGGWEGADPERCAGRLRAVVAAH